MENRFEVVNENNVNYYERKDLSDYNQCYTMNQKIGIYLDNNHRHQRFRFNKKLFNGGNIHNGYNTDIQEIPRLLKEKNYEQEHILSENESNHENRFKKIVYKFNLTSNRSFRKVPVVTENLYGDNNQKDNKVNYAFYESRTFMKDRSHGDLLSVTPQNFHLPINYNEKFDRSFHKTRSDLSNDNVFLNKFPNGHLITNTKKYINNNLTTNCNRRRFIFKEKEREDTLISSPVEQIKKKGFNSIPFIRNFNNVKIYETVTALKGNTNSNKVKVNRNRFLNNDETLKVKINDSLFERKYKKIIKKDLSEEQSKKILKKFHDTEKNLNISVNLRENKKNILQPINTDILRSPKFKLEEEAEKNEYKEQIRNNSKKNNNSYKEIKSSITSNIQKTEKKKFDTISKYSNYSDVNLSNNLNEYFNKDNKEIKPKEYNKLYASVKNLNKIEIRKKIMKNDTTFTPKKTDLKNDLSKSISISASSINNPFMSLKSNAKNNNLILSTCNPGNNTSINENSPKKNKILKISEAKIDKSNMNKNIIELKGISGNSKKKLSPNRKIVSSDEYEENKENDDNKEKQPNFKELSNVKTHKNNSLKILGVSGSEVRIKKRTNIYIKDIKAISRPGKKEDGSRKTNQDKYIAEQSINGIRSFNIFGVFDGHGLEGHKVSDYTSKAMLKKFSKHPDLAKLKDLEEIYRKLKSENFKIITDIFLSIDKEIKNEKFDSEYSGTTCNIVIQIGSHLICANAGDSRAILIISDQERDIIGKSRVKLLSVDNKPDDPKERDRIFDNGGEVEQLIDKEGNKLGPARVYGLGKDYPGLAMSRSIGDFKGKSVGVICNPEFIEHTIDNKTKYMLCCSDGVFEFLSNEQVMDISNPFYLNDDATGLCKELLKRATQEWAKKDLSVDDITALAIFF